MQRIARGLEKQGRTCVAKTDDILMYPEEKDLCDVRIELVGDVTEITYSA